MEPLRKSQSSLHSETDSTIRCTLPRFGLRGCSWTCSWKLTCEENGPNGVLSAGQLSDYFPLLFCSVLSLEESVKAMSLSPEEDDIPWDSMRDNRDLTVFTSWDPKDR